VTIRRGASEDGSFVGEFDVRLGKMSAYVRMGTTEKWMTEVLVSRSASEMIWKFHPEIICWHKQALKYSCRLKGNQGELLATYHAPNYHARNSAVHRQYNHSLQVYPDGQALFDDILISVLILQRKHFFTNVVAPLKAGSR